MFKTFLFGIVLGFGLAFGALYAFPVVDQVRESSIVTVAPNGGNTESFRINIPMDRIMGSGATAVPDGLEWPELAILDGVNVKLFKVRNSRDAVIGVAARTAANSTGTETIEWLLHFPARGSLFVDMGLSPTEEGYRVGELRSGSRELAPLVGTLSERWVPDAVSSEDSSAEQSVRTPQGRIELVAKYVTPHVGELE